MPRYEKKRIGIVGKTLKGERTLGYFLRKLAEEHVEEHRRFLNEVKTPNVNEYRKRFERLLNTKLDPDEVFRLAEMKQKVLKRLRVRTALIRRHSVERRLSNREVIERLIAEYERILKEIKKK